MTLRISQLKARWKAVPRDEEIVIALCQTPSVQLRSGRAFDANEADAAMLDYYRRMEESAILRHKNRRVVESTHYLKLADKYRQRREAIETILKELEE